MKKTQFKAGAGALLFWALVYFISDGTAFAAVLLPAAVHELGHLLCLKIQGLRIRELRLEFCGLGIDYEGEISSSGLALAAAAGPLAGLLLAFLLSRFNNSFAELAAGVSLLLSLFNLLPVGVLDGGKLCTLFLRALLGRERGDRFSLIISWACCCCLAALGLRLFLNGRGAGLLAAALILSASELRR